MAAVYRFLCRINLHPWKRLGTRDATGRTLLKCRGCGASGVF